MKCPHCLVDFYPPMSTHALKWQDGQAGGVKDTDGYWNVRFTCCPNCGKATIFLRLRDGNDHVLKYFMVWPKGVARSPLPADVPETYATDYREACNVHPDSAKASAALSRRCLQRILREVAGVKPHDLSQEINAVLPKLPSALAEALDAVRVIGNFAAHPMKSTNTGEILDVELGEAEWSLDVLESLFDFYFVQPAKLAAKKAEMNAKLKEAGKPPMK
jgi:hypothetical protein